MSKSEDLIKLINENPNIHLIESNEDFNGNINDFYNIYTLDVSPLLISTKFKMKYSDIYQKSKLFDKISIKIETSSEIISKESVAEYNPIIVSICSINNLPGVKIEESLLSNDIYTEYEIKNYSSNHFNYINSNCEPFYCYFKFYNFRYTITPGAIQNKKIKLNFKTVFVTKYIDKYKYIFKK